MPRGNSVVFESPGSQRSSINISARFSSWIYSTSCRFHSLCLRQHRVILCLCRHRIVLPAASSLPKCLLLLHKVLPHIFGLRYLCVDQMGLSSKRRFNPKSLVFSSGKMFETKISFNWGLKVISLQCIKFAFTSLPPVHSLIFSMYKL